MREIRPVQPAEADSFLRVLCDLFDLDFSRARSIFYNEPLFDLQRKWALFESGEIRSILTTVPLQFGWGRAIGIAGVATKTEFRGQGLAGELIEHVLQKSREGGETGALLFAKDQTLYARHGFSTLDEVIRAPLFAEPSLTEPPLLTVPEVQDRYQRWSEKSPARLIRDTQRWNYWKWNLRICTQFAGGYCCQEGNIVRECVPLLPPSRWSLPIKSEWMGLRSLAQSMQMPIGDERFELYLMGIGFDSMPELFMTDQF